MKNTKKRQVKTELRTYTVVYPDYQIVTMETSLKALEKARKMGTVMGWMEGGVKSSLPSDRRPHPFANLSSL